MKKIFLAVVLCATAGTIFSQDLSQFKLYKPDENAEKAIASAVKKAKAAGKYVLVQVGGNWCIWCARFNDFVTKDIALDSLIRADYVVYHLNWSKENRNKEILTRYRFPQRFGFPVFLILNDKGNLIHTQNSEYLEDGVKSYDKRKVMEFLESWCPKAFDPSQYETKNE